MKQSLHVVAEAEKKLIELNREKENVSIRVCVVLMTLYIHCMCVCSWSQCYRELLDMEVVSLDIVNRHRSVYRCGIIYYVCAVYIYSWRQNRDWRLYYVKLDQLK